MVDVLQDDDLAAQAAEEERIARSSTTTMTGDHGNTAPRGSFVNDNVNALAPRSCSYIVRTDGRGTAWGMAPAGCNAHDDEPDCAPVRAPVCTQIGARLPVQEKTAPYQEKLPEQESDAPLAVACASPGKNHTPRARFLGDVHPNTMPLTSFAPGEVGSERTMAPLLGTPPPPPATCFTDPRHAVTLWIPQRPAAFQTVATLIHLSTRIAVRNIHGRACAAPPCVRAHMRSFVLGGMA